MPSARCHAVGSDWFAPAPLAELLFEQLRQRARLFELILLDLRGPRTALARGVLPAPFCPDLAPPSEDRGLQAYAAELMLWPDGVWRVARDVVPGADHDASARLLQAPALSAFLPGLCRFLLGETLRLDSAPSRWLGDPGALSAVAASRNRWAIVDAFEPGSAVCLRDLTVPERAALQDRVSAAPGRFAARLLNPGETDRVTMARTGCGDWIAVPEKNSSSHPQH